MGVIVFKSCMIFPRSSILLSIFTITLLLSLFTGSRVWAIEDGWTHFEHPILWCSATSGQQPRFFGIWGTDEQNVIVVGKFQNCSNQTTAKAYRFDGHTYSEMDMEELFDTELHDVWGASANEIFAVGVWFETSTTNTYPYIQFFNGSNWSMMSAPSGVEDLNAVWGFSNSDVFAGGKAAIIHFDGTDWTSMTIPAIDWVYGMWGSSNNNVYAVGTWENAGVTNGLILRYDGATWTQAASYPDVRFSAVWGTDANNVYAVGMDASTLKNPLIYRYNGVSWGKETIPDPPADVMAGEGVPLNGIWGSSASDIYVVGGGGYHYDGTNWEYREDLGTWDAWGTSDKHVFQCDYSLMKKGAQTTSTTGIKVQISTGTSYLETFVAVDPNTISDQENRPSSLPLGLFDFTIPVTAGEKATFTFEIPQELAVTDWFKHNDTDGWFKVDGAKFTQIFDPVGKTFLYTLVTFDITDNQKGDSDPRAGYIRDPSGPGNEGAGIGGGGGGGGGGGCFIPSLAP